MKNRMNRLENRLLLITFSVFSLVFLVFLKNFFVDYLWFDSLGYVSRFIKVIRVKLLVFLFFFLLSFLFLFLNSLVLKWNAKKKIKKFKGLLFILNNLTSLFIVSFIYAIIPAQWWEEVLNFLNSVKFNMNDPIFRTDIGFYVFKLPLYNFLKSWSLFFFLFLLVWNILYYFFSGLLTFNKNSLCAAYPVRVHIGMVFFLVLINISIGFYLSRFSVLFNQGLMIKGASYLDVYGRLPFYNLFFSLFLLISFTLVYWIIRPRNILIILPAGILLILIFLRGIYPFLLQQFVIVPNEIEKEKPYIENTIKFTKIAYRLNNVRNIDRDIKSGLSMKKINQEKEVISNIKIWDPRQIKTVFNLLQSFRPYYLFYNVDIDRYRISGKLREVKLSAREMSRDNLPPVYRNWVNKYLRYTHGYGLVMSPVGSKDRDSLPAFYIKDLPLETLPDLPVTRPEIYFGELARDYVIVRTKVREFDYPQRSTPVSAVYQGNGGILLDTFWKKLLMAVHLSDFRILFSRLITVKSRLIIKRNIIEIAKSLVPFLLLDNDPYLVLVQGRLYWYIDACTYTDKFPYSDMYNDSLNYIRNSVKIIIDAYSGRVDLYVTDNKDPIIRSYQKTFPGLFRNLNQLGPEFREHFRYPSDLFMIQAEILCRYHVSQPETLYHNEDMWDIPSEILDDTENLINSHYMINRLHGQEKLEFLNIIPFKSSRHSSLTGMLLAGCDNSRYGHLVIYTFTNKEQPVDLLQVNAAINEDNNISELLNMWKKKAWRVVTGNLIVVPVEASLIYFQSLFFYPEGEKLPRLKKVLLFYNNKVVLANDIREGLQQVLTGRIRYTDNVKSELVDRMGRILEKLGKESGNKDEIDELRILLKQIK
ncbi:MAG: UPF0182 family protein [bacterium]|nr:UPF0182 family protein [bacterium]